MRREPSVVLVTASVRGAWRGAVLPATAGLVFIVAGSWTKTLGVVVAGAGWVLFGVLRAGWWARVCATSQLVDDGDELVWMYRGERREAVAWTDLRHVLFQRWARQLVWAIGSQGADHSRTFWSTPAPIPRPPASATSPRSWSSIEPTSKQPTAH